MDEMLREEDIDMRLTPFEQSFAFNCRAQCHAFLGETAAAEKDYAESIRLDPGQVQWYMNRASFWDANGRPDLAQADRSSAAEMAAARKRAWRALEADQD
jgi:hypothetical protein